MGPTAVTYDGFERLMHLKFSLLRSLHNTGPSGHATLRRALAEVEHRLGLCPDYGEYMSRYARSPTCLVG
ncbi:MAG: hypothetical protein HY722_01090 [Planctomycetes bacterium]|nr:hypothetical protein [Planctomycetota bacterium]